MTNNEQRKPRRKTLDAQIAFRASATVSNRLKAVATEKGVSASSLALWIIVSGLDRLQKEMIG